jgi:hypothetical protein
LLAANFEDTVILNSRRNISAGRLRFSFAHELAHVLIRRRQMPWVRRKDEEWWADWFACELIFPRKWLRGKLSWQFRISARQVGDLRVVALQLAAESQPQLWRADDEVICGRCGDSVRFDDCPCRRYRADTDLRRELPNLIAARPLFHQLSLFATDPDLLALM